MKAGGWPLTPLGTAMTIFGSAVILGLVPAFCRMVQIVGDYLLTFNGGFHG